MKSTILGLITLIATMPMGCNTNNTCVHEKEIEWIDSIVYYHGSLFTGCINSYDSNENLVLLSKVVNGMNEGEMIEYYPSGSKHYVSNWKGNHLHGDFTEYYPAGEVKFKGNFINGKLNGTSTSYFENGALSKKVNFDDGLKIGKYLEFSVNGDTSVVGYYKVGNRDSIWCFPKDMSIKEKNGSTTVYNLYHYYFSDTVSLNVSDYAVRLNQWDKLTLDTLGYNLEFHFDNNKRIVEVVR